MSNASSSIAHHGTVYGAMHKFSRLIVDLQCELSGRGDDEDLGWLRVVSRGTIDLLVEQTGDDWQQKGSLLERIAQHLGVNTLTVRRT